MLQKLSSPADLTFKILDSPEPVTGAGKIVEMTSVQVVFTTEWPVPAGSRVELSVRWPAPTGVPPTLRLLLHGTVVRSEKREVVVDIEKYGG